jgi:tetratricopeptide (TPR) repeat protein
MSQFTSRQAFDLALKHHQAGRLYEAEQLYRKILAQQPEHSGAILNLGVIALRVGRTDAAADLFRKAIAINPADADAFSNLGNALADQRRLEEAITAYRQAIAVSPNNARIRNNLANALRENGQLDEAIAVFREAIALNPNLPEVHGNFASALHDKGCLDDAIAEFRRAISLRPAYPEAYCDLGIALKSRGQLDQAIAAYRQAIALNPKLLEAYANLGSALKNKGDLDGAIAAYRGAVALNPNLAEAQSNLGNLLRDKGQTDEAIIAYQQAIAAKPDLAEAHYNLGNAFNSKGLFDSSIAAYRRAISLKPDYVDAHMNLGNALKANGQLDESIAEHRRVIALDPDYATGHYNLSLGLLTKGEFSEGWQEYEWRWKRPDFTSPARNFPRPRWDGKALEGRTILLHSEQGFGDAIQYIRYASLVAKRGGKIIIECLPPVVRLFRSIGDYQLVPSGQSLPEFDVQCPLLSLPKVFRTTLGNVPNAVPYLHPDPDLVDFWRQKLGSPEGKFKIGLVWAGNPKFKFDQTRSLNLNQLAPFSVIPGVQFYSLQKGPAGEQAKNPPSGLQLIDLGPDLTDFADTAAVMSLMDLIITTDTSAPHLAGAIARPVWIMLQFMPHFCWMLNRDDCPWYPTARLFRQPTRGDWDSVIARVASEIAARAHAG